MKKIRLFLSGILFISLFFLISVNAYAVPKVMSDGQIFDAEFYADQYPDVKAAFGYDEAKLYAHYLTYGKKEGRLPYKPDAASALNTAQTIPVTKDLTVGNIDGGVEKQTEIQLGYIALPQNVKNFYNKKNIRIYACTKEHIGAISAKPTIGLSRLVWDDSGALCSADVYVCGSANSYMPPRYTLYHELGHVLNFRTQYSANWGGWIEVIPYNKAQAYNSEEAFSEAFAGYFERPEKLKKIAPNAYVYIENIVANMK